MRISDWSSDVCSSDLPTRASRHDDAALPRQCFRAANTAGRSLRSSLESHHGSPTVCRCRCAIHAQGRRVALLAFPGPRSMAMHNPRFPRIRPLALSLLLACGAGASLPAVAGIPCVVEHTEDGTQDPAGAITGPEDARTTAPSADRSGGTEDVSPCR